MTNQAVRRLLWHRYWGVLLVACGLALIGGVRAAINTAILADKVFLHGAPANDNGVPMLLAIFGMVIILGWFTFMWDNYTNFNHYLLALRATRQQLYQQKIGLFMSTIVISDVLMQGVFLGLVRLLTHYPRAYNLNWGATLRYTISQLMFILALYLLVATIGLWLGQPLASALVILIFLPSLVFFYDGVLSLSAKLMQVSSIKIDPLHQLNQATWPGFWLVTMGALVVIIGLYGLNRWASQHLSLKNSGDFLLFPQFRTLFLWLAVVYLSVSVGFSGFCTLLLNTVTSQAYDQFPWSQGIIMAIVTAYLTWSIGRWLMYRPDRVLDAFKFKKLN
ncbi:hypothetical protein C5Z26_09400 [Lactobacillus sp. CBA3606]|uniref:hypothetical protein n=1 Tax=Lactobacillus sp. CBA3606 TaxID=2099789 RepID=UPI000CFB4698|nr:hypothetical protein [Lactobacillus sp. CBA3606]AVK64316.1 hypothetical protein C5Z26_09400 [Lactobacillus sp. CBA3606]